MTTWTLTYAEVGSRGELIQHKEEYPSRISAGVNFFFARRDPKKSNCRLTKETK
jgi:hypothetical protein